jgi:hypothetical protein
VKRPIAKPVPTVLDGEGIMDYAGLLADDIVSRAQDVNKEQESGVVDDHAVLLKSTYGLGVPEDDGRWVEVQVLVSSARASDLDNDGPLIVASMAHGPESVEVVLNGSYSWKELQARRDAFVQALYRCLLRDLTGAVEYDKPDPHERKLNPLQDLADEALARAEEAKKGRNPTRDMVLDAVRGGKFYRAAAGMPPRERAQALKIVYSSLVDAGLV